MEHTHVGWEEWPLFTLQWHQTESGLWAEMMNIAPFWKQPFRYAKAHFAEVARLEAMLRRRGAAGWAAVIYHGNTKMNRAVSAWGAVWYRSSKMSAYYYKPAQAPTVPPAEWRRALRGVRQREAVCT